MSTHRTLFVTQRAPRHQQAALEAAPPALEIIMRQSPSKQEILALMPEVEFFISERTGVIDADIIAACRNVKLIQRLGSQTYDIDLNAARAAGIPVCYLPLDNCIMVAEHTLLLMLALLKHLPEVSEVAKQAADWGIEPQPCDANYFAYNWSRRRGLRSLSSTTVGILGMGEIGSELARRLRGLAGEVLYNKRSRLPEETEKGLGVRYVSRAEIQEQSDILVVLVPHSDETAHMINAAFVDKMKPTALLVNTGTSSALNEQDVAEAICQNRLAGLATDGFAWEPIRPDNPLLPLARDPRWNVILTPHTGAGDVSAHRDARVRDYANIVCMLAGEPLRYRLV